MFNLFLRTPYLRQHIPSIPNPRIGDTSWPNTTFVNTNEKYALGQYPVWIDHKLAFTHGGDADRKLLQQLSPGCICLMMIDAQGLKAVGEVREDFDGIPHRTHMVKREEIPDFDEYRIKVDWFLKLDQPIPFSHLRAWGFTTIARPSVKRLEKDKRNAVELVEDLLHDQIEDPAERLDRLTAEHEWTEGKAYQVTVTRYERRSDARAACVKAHGFSCAICNFNFEDAFGEEGKGIIQVHHLNPFQKVKGQGRLT